MKKILFVVPSISQTNGIATFLINYLSNMELKELDITVLTSNYNPSKEHINFFKSKNIPLYFLDDFRQCGMKKYIKSLKQFFKEHHDFDVVYSNIANQSIFIFGQCVKYKIKKRIIHSHATISSDNKKRAFINDIVIKIVLKFATGFTACTEDAGVAMFKKKKFKVVKNAIDYNKFLFNKKIRKDLRKKLNVKDDEVLIGFVGRFAPQKNIYFFEKLAKLLKDNQKIIMIGNGYQKNEFVKKLEEENLINKFIFIDECSNVNEYYSAMDVFCLPSVYEGLGIVGIEAQANGMKTILSTGVPKDCKILESTVFIDKDEIEQWFNQIEQIDNNQNREVENLKDDYNITVQAREFEKYLMEI